MSIALAIDARTECYEDLRGMLYHIAHLFVRRFHVELEEAVSEAHVAFCEAFLDWDANKASFKTWVYRKAWNRLLEWHRTMMRRKILNPVADIELETLALETKETVHDLMDVLSSDGREILAAIFDSPREIVHDLVCEGMSPSTFKRALREFFHDCGWTEDRLLASFEEIKGKL